MRHILLIVCCVFSLHVSAQDTSPYEKSPVFPECESVENDALKACFYEQLSERIFQNFKIPQDVTECQLLW